MKSFSPFLLCFLLPASLFPAASADHPGKILVVTATSEDYLLGAGGTLAKLVLEGYEVHVAQFGNDEKKSAGLTPAETRWANVEEGKAAAELLGITRLVYMGHKSGEIGYVSSTEMRKQLFGLIRYLKPRKIFIPDAYVHYQSDWDVYFVGRMAEEAWGYSGGAMFGPELARMGLAPYGVPEVYFYPVGRPYRAGEGGEKNARFLAIDISDMLEAKMTAVAMLRSRNRSYALQVASRLEQAGRKSEELRTLDDGVVKNLAKSRVEELAAVIGQNHGLGHAEEFNYVGPGDPIPPHALERAVRRR